MSESSPQLMECKVCSREVASTAETCPHCGVDKPAADAYVPPAGMAPCNRCKKIIQKGIKKCPHCGTKDPTMTPKEMMVITIITVVILIGVCVWWFSSTSSSTPASDQNSSSTTGDVHGAWAYMQLFVEERLKSPRSADFPFGGYRHVTPLGGGSYRVNSYVDSENSFGGEIRTNFHGVISRTSNGWKLESLEFN